MKMPVSRDVRVSKLEPKDQESGPGEARKRGGCSITVMGFDGKDVLFETDDAGSVLWRDSSGEPAALLARIKSEIWGFSRKGDPDWDEVLKIYGP